MCQPLGGGLKFQSPKSAETTIEKPKRQRKEKIKNDPKFVSAARELRDRWLEQVNSGQYLPEAAGKYEVSKTLSDVDGSRALIDSRHERTLGVSDATPLLPSPIAA